ncbi:MAG: hypothetical protein JW808_09880 [Victivallales bacterium]|nr:hypothetical protein [Victivallales bacterium]
MGTLKDSDRSVLRELGKRYAAISAESSNEEKRRLCRCLNGLRAERPMVMIDQICWSEIEGDSSLKCACEDSYLRSIERSLRRNIYRHMHFPVDKVFDPWITVDKAVNNTGFGILIDEETAVFEPGNDVVSHKYINLFQTEDDLDRIKTPAVSHDEAETARRLEVAHEVFDGILDVRVNGLLFSLSLWDPLAMWMNVEEALFAMIDRPEFVHKILERMTQGYLSMLDQLESKGLLCCPQSEIHCTGAFTDDLPAEGYDAERPRCKDIWMSGLAQMLGTVSPEMFDEFEIAYTSRLCERFGLVYYGCCDPLDKKMAQVRKLPNVRKVSMSPWADQANGAEQIGKDFVFSSKPNPANVAMQSFDPSIVRKELEGIKKVCDDNGCALEFILKDISTIRHDPARLEQWAQIAMDVVCG